MKKVAVIFLVFFSFLISCNKDRINNTAEKVGTSKVTYFPVLTMSGGSIIAIPKGGTFNDPGVSAKAGTTDVAVTVTGTVNTSQEGVYTLNYSAVNVDGFSATTNRTVAVYNTSSDAASQDLSGNYLRAATGVLCNWTKIAPGVYVVTNPGGASAGASLKIVVFNPTGYTITAPSQRSNDGNISATGNEIYSPDSPAKYSWIFLNPGYGTGVRSFVKQ